MLDRLPYELFRRIIRDTDVGFLSPLMPPGPDIYIPPITAPHVCGSWRAALLSDPTMWTCLRIPQMGPAQVKEMLHRSVHAPLNVFIETALYPRSAILHTLSVCQGETLPSVFQEMHRLKRLQINLSMLLHRSLKALAYIVLSYLDQPAPMLEKFYLNIEPQRDAELPGGANFIRELFSGDAPNLKHVFRQVPGDFQQLSSSPCFRDLSSLHLKLKNHTIIPCDILLDILESSPFLRTLEIYSARKDPTLVPPASAARRVALSHLQTLNLKDDSGVDIANLVFSHLLLPQNVNYSIRCYDFQQKMSKTTPLSRLLSQRRLTYLKLLFFPRASVYLDFHERHPIPHEASFFINSELEPPVSSTNNLHILLQRFKLSDITYLTLQFRTDPEINSTRLMAVFASLINLSFLQLRYNVRGPSEETFLQASLLMSILPSYVANLPLGDRRRDDALHTCPCPCLRTLAIIIGGGFYEVGWSICPYARGMF